MARVSNRFVCQSCGAVHGKWSGRCDSCNEWNSIVEEVAEAAVPKGVTKAGGKPVAFTSLDGAPENRERRLTGIKELDRVCGGGLVPGSALLVGGDPGIGKSTLLLQAAALLAKSGVSVAYISGEEAIDQIRLRAARLARDCAGQLARGVRAHFALSLELLDGLVAERIRQAGQRGAKIVP